MIELDLSGRSYRLLGEEGPISEALHRTLDAAQATRAEQPDMLVLCAPLVPDESFRAAPLLDLLSAAAPQTKRIVLCLSAAGLVPMRRFPRFSAETSALVLAVRAEAARRAPATLVNAVAAGQLDGDSGPLSGDAAMAGHAPLGRLTHATPICEAVLFFCDPLNSYCTGQTLAVDCGWSTGFARSF